ncbi:hypothetical protein E4U56_003442 [Claviceps arundinis]|uniref:Retrovirus-related Pol polyprotein from transposon TNT 1-94-like beta-barrel domain-containing protein n=1 Tax=Claviceps arundinis TaxID=1623583 RepID=A0A9P7MPK5_9HYPO|nr:hypothetical protein E4U56_003442 [Claviceps arundinis]
MLVEKQEQHLNERVTQVSAMALNAHKPRSRGPRYCDHCKKPTHYTDSCFIKFPEKKKAFDDRRARRDGQKANHQGPARDNQATIPQQPLPDTTAPAMTAWVPPTEVGFYSCVSSIIGTAAAANKSPLLQNWILDSGASQHISCQLGYFAKDTLRKYTGPATCGYGGSLNMALQVGTAILPCRPGTKLIYLSLPNTLYDPNAACNLVSYSQLKANGTRIEQHEQGFVLITDSGRVIAQESSGIYWLHLERAAIEQSSTRASLPAYAIKEA